MSAHDSVEPDPTADHTGSDARRQRLVTLLHDAGSSISPSPSPPGALPGSRGRLERLCVITVSEVAVDGAGVTVMGGADAGRAGHRDQIAATGALARRLEDLQLTAGEGPCLDAFSSGAPALAPDIAATPTRWLGFGPEAVTAGAAAVFSLPLQVGAVRLGTLDLHRTTAGPLSGEQFADALALAALATEALLELAAEHPDPDQAPDTGWLPDVHADVHVASGMVSARQGIDVSAALLRIRAYAFAQGEPIHQVARHIIADDLVLTDDRDDPETRDTATDDHGPSAPDPETD